MIETQQAGTEISIKYRPIKNDVEKFRRIKEGTFNMHTHEVRYLQEVNGVKFNYLLGGIYTELLDGAEFRINKLKSYYAPPIASLADEFGVSFKTMLGCINKLVKAGLVVRLTKVVGRPSELAVIKLDGTVIQPETTFEERVNSLTSRVKIKTDIRVDTEIKSLATRGVIPDEEDDWEY